MLTSRHLISVKIIRYTRRYCNGDSLLHFFLLHFWCVLFLVGFFVWFCFCCFSAGYTNPGRAVSCHGWTGLEPGALNPSAVLKFSSVPLPVGELQRVFSPSVVIRFTFSTFLFSLHSFQISRRLSKRIITFEV